MNEQPLSRSLPRYTTPLALRTSILAAVQPTQKRAWPKFVLRWALPLTTAVAFGIWIGSLLPFDFGSSLTHELVWDHINALKSGRMIAVISSDKHTVKPWFAGKIDFSPTVIDLAAEGFPLLGGRTGRIDSHDVAVLTYAAGKHYIELFEWPSKKVAKSKDTYRGYQAAKFSIGETLCYAVSDASREEIERFEQVLLKQATN